MLKKVVEAEPVGMNQGAAGEMVERGVERLHDVLVGAKRLKFSVLSCGAVQRVKNGRSAWRK